MKNNNTVWTIIIIAILVILGIILLSSKPEVVEPEGEMLPEEEGEMLPEEEGEMLPEEEGEFIPEEGEAEEVSESVVPDASPVSEEGEVLTSGGEVADNTALPGSPDAPRQSRALTEEEVPETAVKLSISASGFTPSEFTVNASDVVTLSLTSTDRTHVFKFDDASLQAVAIGVAGNETRAITFKAPAAGDYTFYCDVPGHRGRGETGVMHVE
ncbi:cupredoxin domain-containing protein [Patescibacteria group bacterium]|nr:cupredoxin domain-containing protein [Patescibacteria group bacterium]